MGETLITYYSKTNTTKEICEYIKTKLEEKDSDAQVTMKPMTEVTDFNGYDEVILGAPINGMRWAEDAMAFMAANMDGLKDKTISLFYVSYLLDNGRKIWQKAIRKSLDKYKKDLNPKAVAGFYGRVDKHFTGMAKFMLGPSSDAPLDRVDYSMVDEFIEKL